MRADGDSSRIAVTLLRSLYLGWIIQAFALQQLFDYMHVPCVMLALAVCVQAGAGALKNSWQAATTATGSTVSMRSMIVPVTVAFAALCLLHSPVSCWDRQRHWLASVKACAGSPPSSQIKDDIAIGPLPRWAELRPMLETLQGMTIPDGSVMAYSVHTIHLYPGLQVHPPTRFVFLDALARCFPRRRPEMVAALENSGIRYVISDRMEDGWERDLSGNFILPDAIREHSDTMFFPYNQTPVYRSDGYELFEVILRANMEFW